MWFGTGTGKGGYLHQGRYLLLLSDSQTGQPSLGESEIGLFALHLRGALETGRRAEAGRRTRHTLGALQEAEGYGRSCRHSLCPSVRA